MATTTSAASNAKTYKNFVNNQWVAAASGETFPVYDPSTEEVIANVAAADKSDVDAAVKAAREAFDNGPWRQTTAQDRGRILFKLAEKIRAKRRRARRTRMSQLRQAHRRSRIRHRRRRHLLRVLRRPRHKSHRPRQSRARQRAQLHACANPSASPRKSFRGTIRF